MNIRISADSTCDLSQALVEQYNICITPLYVEMDGKSHRDGIEIHPEDIFAYVGGNKGVCKTAAVNVADYQACFRQLLEQADAVIHLNISSEMSSCYQNACIAAEELENVYVIDARNLSTGIGLLVLEAAEQAKQGLDAKTIAENLTALTEKVEASFVIDTLFYLQKGGRCSALVALGANLLKLKPCIEVKAGKMGVGKKYRGKIESCIEQYVRERLEGRDDIRRDRIFITHTCDDRSMVERAEKVIAEVGGFSQVLETRAGCTVSTHCGPNTLGVLFLRK